MTTTLAKYIADGLGTLAKVAADSGISITTLKGIIAGKKPSVYSALCIEFATRSVVIAESMVTDEFDKRLLAYLRARSAVPGTTAPPVVTPPPVVQPPPVIVPPVVVTPPPPVVTPPPTSALTLAGIDIHFGGAGKRQVVTFPATPESSGMPVGFNGAVQSSWRGNPVMVDDCECTVYAMRDSDGRISVRLHAGWLADPAGKNGIVHPRIVSNRTAYPVELQVAVDNVLQPLWGETTYAWNFQRGTALRWESRPVDWKVTPEHIQSLMASGAMMRHKSDGVFGVLKDAGFPENIPYQPFKQFGDYHIGNFVGDLYRGSAVGGDRNSVGLKHEWFCRLAAEVGTHGTTAFATTGRINTLKALSETASQMQFSSGLISTVDYRLLDPGSTEQLGPYCCHKNTNATFNARCLPQAGTDYTLNPLNCSFDIAHPQNLISYYAYLLSNDPHHLFNVQAAAVTALTNATLYGNGRLADGTRNMIAVDEERGFGWGLMQVVEAWRATPEGDMPKPFHSKAFFEEAIDNTLEWMRECYLPGASHPISRGLAREANLFWGNLTEFVLPQGIAASNMMNDYLHIAFCHILRMGYSKARDLVEFYSRNAKNRAKAGGNWYDIDFENGNVSYLIAPLTGTDLPYKTIEEYKAWNPHRDSYRNGDITSEFWIWNHQHDGNYTYLFSSALLCYKELQAKGLVTLDWDAAAAHAEFMRHLVQPFLNPDGSPARQQVRAKHTFGF